MYLKGIIALSLTLSLLGCATPGTMPTAATESTINKSREFNAPFDQVWPAIIAVVAESNLSITTLEKDSGIIAISNSTYSPQWAHEGTRGSVMGAPDIVNNRTANFNIFAASEGAEQTLVRVNSSFKMQIRTGNNSQAFPYRYRWHKSYSNGTLERKILSGIRSRIQR